MTILLRAKLPASLSAETADLFENRNRNPITVHIGLGRSYLMMDSNALRCIVIRVVARSSGTDLSMTPCATLGSRIRVPVVMAATVTLTKKKTRDGLGAGERMA